MSDLRRTVLPGIDREALWTVNDLPLVLHAPEAPLHERIHVSLSQRDRRRMFEGKEHVHGPSSGRGHHAARHGRVRARRERHLGSAGRHAVLRARLRGRGRRRL
nr:hypothetical protein GCM10017745_48620 [Saccharothrix mutabilis subsp. capreolus]